MITNVAEVASRMEARDIDMDRAILALWPTAYRIARLILRDDDAAKDIAQESCVRALQHRDRMRDPDALSPWFRTLVANGALAYRRKRERDARREARFVADAPTVVPAFADTVDIADALARLHDDLRIPVILFYYTGCTSGEIGKQLGLPAATVRSRLAAARAALKPLLGESS